MEAMHLLTGMAVGGYDEMPADEKLDYAERISALTHRLGPDDVELVEQLLNVSAALRHSASEIRA